MAQWQETLGHEFAAGDGSFLSRLRGDLTWDRQAFATLTDAMRDCCEIHAETAMMERWVAEGFWYLQRFVRDWTQHPKFPRPYPADYYDRAYGRLDDLGEWFFTGSCPYEPGTGFAPIG